MLADTRDENAELTELNNRELRVLQCSAAIIIGVLRDGVKAEKRAIRGGRSSNILSLLLGSYHLRTVIYMLKRTPELSDRTRFTLIVDAAFKDTVNLKQLFQVAAAAVLYVQSENYRPSIGDVVSSLILVNALIALVVL